MTHTISQYQCIFYFHYAALSGFNYIAALYVLTFTSGSRNGDTKCADITILDNDVLERDKTFSVTLTVQNPRVILRNTISIITITDNES